MQSAGFEIDYAVNDRIETRAGAARERVARFCDVGGTARRAAPERFVERGRAGLARLGAEEDAGPEDKKPGK